MQVNKKKRRDTNFYSFLQSHQLLCLLIMLLLADSLVVAQRNKPRPTKPKPTTTAPATPTPTPAPVEPPLISAPATPLTLEQMQQLRAVIETTQGDLILDFYPQSAPNHVRQFVWLAQAGYFDGMSISRIIPNLLIQSGNPASWQAENPNKTRRFEIAKLKAEYDNSLKHERGTLSMARPNGEPDGGTTHFFICVRAISSLDGQYTIFGKVSVGLELLDKLVSTPIAEGTPDEPRDRIDVKRITIKEMEAAKP
jgi:peptidyl-prolyl cis-trans isomerase B (cyclophilin B)